MLNIITLTPSDIHLYHDDQIILMNLSVEYYYDFCITWLLKLIDIITIYPVVIYLPIQF